MTSTLGRSRNSFQVHETSLLDEAEAPKGPGPQVQGGRLAVGEHRPLLGEDLPRRQALGSRHVHTQGYCGACPFTTSAIADSAAPIRALTCRTTCPAAFKVTEGDFSPDGRVSARTPG